MKITKGKFDKSGRIFGWIFNGFDGEGSSSILVTSNKSDCKDYDNYLYIPEYYKSGPVILNGIEIVDWTKERESAMRSE